jgi:aspartate/glutamate racemase
MINHWQLPVVLGCTELPLLLKSSFDETSMIDPTKLLAQAAIDFVGDDV